VVTVFARTTTFRGERNAIDSGIATVRDEVMPAVRQMPGCVGASALVDRESGSLIATSAWETEQAMRDSEQGVAPLRDRAQRIFSSQPDVRRWEITLLHRTRHLPEGACARVTWSRGDPARAQEVLDTYKATMLPKIESLPGFCSVSLLLDRETGDGASAVTYESREALEASRQAAAGVRSDAMSRLGLELLDVAEFEVLYAHLRVPETV
jgi:heme-degrading monooxygenase HmoA